MHYIIHTTYMDIYCINISLYNIYIYYIYFFFHTDLTVRILYTQYIYLLCICIIYKHYYVHYNTIYESFLKNQNVILMNQNYYESLRA